MKDTLSAKEILTRAEAMKILKVGRNTLYKMIQSGELKGYKQGNRYKIPAQSIIDYIDSNIEA